MNITERERETLLKLLQRIRSEYKISRANVIENLCDRASSILKTA